MLIININNILLLGPIIYKYILYYIYINIFIYIYYNNMRAEYQYR